MGSVCLTINTFLVKKLIYSSSGQRSKIQKVKRTFQPVSEPNLERGSSGIFDTLRRIPISKPLTHRIIIIEEKFSGMSLTRERIHELDKIFLLLFTFANKQ